MDRRLRRRQYVAAARCAERWLKRSEIMSHCRAFSRSFLVYSIQARHLREHRTAKRRLRCRIELGFGVLGLICGVCAPLAAQSRFAAAGAFGFADSVNHHSDSRLTPNLDGSALTGLVSVDRIVTQRISVGAELSISSEIKGRQQQRTSDRITNFRSRHHDTIASGAIKMNLLTFVPTAHRPDFRVDVAAVAGGGLAWRHTVRAGTSYPFQGSLVTNVEQDFSDVVSAATVGVNGTFVFSSRVAAMLTARYYMLADDDRDAAGVPRRGVNSKLFIFGVGTRFTF